MILHLNVKPGRIVDQFFYIAAGMLIAKINAPAQDSKANAYVVGFLANQFGIARSNVTILSGFTSQFKRVDVTMDDELIQRIMRNISTS